MAGIFNSVLVFATLTFFFSFFEVTAEARVASPFVGLGQPGNVI